MTQTPITVTYSLEEVLSQISQKLDRIDTKFEHKLDEICKDIDTKFERIDTKFERIDTKFESLRKDIDTKFETMDTKFESLRKDMDTKFETLQKDIVEIKLGQVRMEEEVRGTGKRLDIQEFISRSVVVGLILALVAGILKLFLPNIVS